MTLGDAPPAISVRDVEKSYGDVRALRGVSLDIPQGKFVTLLGPSGSGKTTLLQVLAGFLPPNRGAVIAGGVDVTRLPAHKRNFGLVFQHYALFPHMSVRDNVAYPLRMRHLPQAERRTIVDEYLGLVELADLGDRYPDELSGGQRQRVALARALVFKPPVLLMDEPLGALDRRLRQSIQFRIKRLQQDLGATVLHVTHDQEEALAMSDVIAVMRDGVVEQRGTPLELYQRPATPFVAGFMGETNRLEAHARTVNGIVEVRLDAADQVLRLPHGAVSGLNGTERPAIVCVRPEHVRVLREVTGESIRGDLVTRTFMGDHWRYEIRLGNTAVIAKTPAVGGGGFIAEEGPISVEFDRESIQTFVDRLRPDEAAPDDQLQQEEWT
jgi:ABC-type Fe3+/spermidine/putrescine transport system ATPase subunit